MDRKPRSDGASTHTPTKGTAKLRPAPTPAHTINDLQNAIKNNPPGVRLAARNIESNKVQLAHYVGFNKTDGLKDWFDNSLVGKGVIHLFYLSFKNKFGNVKQSSTKVKKIFLYAYSNNAPSMFDKPIPLPKDPDNINPNKAEMGDRAIWTYVVAMHKIMVQDPIRFFAEPIITNQKRQCPGLLNEESGEDTLRNGHSPEDWNRAYWLLRAKIRIESRPDKQNTNTARRNRSDEAEEPLYLTVDQERTRTLEVEESRASDADSAPGRSLSTDNNNDLVDEIRFIQESDPGDEITEPLNLEDQKASFEMLENMMQKNISQSTGKITEEYSKHLRSKKLSAERQEVLCQEMCDQVTILYPLITPTSPLVPTTTQIEQMTREFFESNPNDNNLARQLPTKVTETANETRSLNEILTAELLGDNRDKVADPSKVEDLRKAYMTLQTTLNAVSAIPPTYVAACRNLGLDPNRPILELATIAAQTKRKGTDNRERNPGRSNSWPGQILWRIHG